MQKEDILRSQFIARLEDALDVNFGVSEIEIDTLEKFNEELYVPFLQGSGVVYRGERIHSQQRRLIPTLLRQKASELKELEIEKSLNINGRYLFDMYVAKERFYEVYNLLYGDTDRYKMYNMTALAQHYLDLSPFIDFTKSLYVSLSFAIKGRVSAEEDFVIYTVRTSRAKTALPILSRLTSGLMATM